MRVLMVVRQYYPWVGGTERQAEKLSRALIDLGTDVKIITGWWFRGTPQQEIINNIPVYRNFTMWRMFDIRGLRKFGSYLYMLTLFTYLWRHRHHYDVIHVHMLNFHTFVSVLAGRWLKKKTLTKIACSHSYSDIRRMEENSTMPGTRHMLPTALKSDLFLALSSVGVEELQEAGIASEKIVTIPNGVEVKGIPAKMDYRLNDPITLVFVGRLHTQKGLDILLPAFNHIITARPDLSWRLLLIGEGPLRSQLEAMARQLDSGVEVVFCGTTDDVPAYLMQSDLFVLPSRAEGMSNALLEAMAYGLPCVATKISGNEDLIRHGENGLLVPSENEEKLAEAIVQLVDDEILRRRVGESARRTVETEYSIESIARRYLKLYDTLLAENS